MIIDCHTHIGAIMTVDEKPYLTVEGLVDWMNRHHIDRAVLLPTDNPEASYGRLDTLEVLSAWRTYPERIVPFGSVDPRRPGAIRILQAARERGCVGFGEHKVGLPIDHPLSVRLYKCAGELGLPVLIHLDHLVSTRLNYDEPGLPRLEKLICECKDTNFIMHGPGWWAEISAEPPPGVGYPKGKIKPGGAVDRLFSNYPNIYGDLSAGSGYNALTRDPDFTPRFLEKHWKRLLFGTDYLSPGQNCPIISLMAELDIPSEWKEAIYSENLLGLLGQS